MKVFIQELQLSLKIDDSLFQQSRAVIHVIDKILTPIVDRKAQLQFDAQYYVDSFAQFAAFHRMHQAGLIVVGAMLLLSLNIFKLHYTRRAAFLDMSDNEILNHPEFSAYLSTDSYRGFVDASISIQDTSTQEKARDSIKAVLRRITQLTYNDSAERNVAIIFSLSDITIRGLYTVSILNARSLPRTIDVLIESTNTITSIIYNGSEEEYALLDKWMELPEFKLAMRDNTLTTKDEDSFLKWFNALRSKLDSECNYITLINHINQYPKEQSVRFAENIKDKIAAIAAENSDSIYQTRLRVLSYINGLLNLRSGSTKIKFVEMDEWDIRTSFDKKHKRNVLSLYH